MTYQGNLETSIEGCDSIFDSVQPMYCKCQKVTFRLVGWIEKKKPTLNLKNKNDKCFQYVVTVVLNYEEIKWNPERVSNIKPFTNKYKSKGISYPYSCLYPCNKALHFHRIF